MDRVGELAESLRALGSACMTWWVSATVLCVTILGAAWIYRQKIRKAGRLPLHALFLMVAIFFATMVLFGVQAVLMLRRLVALLSDACVEAGPARCLPIDAQEIGGGTSALILIGTSSFMIFLFAWLISWWFTVREGSRRALPTRDTQADAGEA